MTEHWEFHFKEEEEKRDIFDDEKHRITVTKSIRVTNWERPQWIPTTYEDFVYDDHIHHSFVCVMFEQCNPDLQNEVPEEYQEEYDQLLANITNGVHFKDESVFKEEIERVNEIGNREFSYLILTTTEMSFTPIYIDTNNVWYRFDVFPLHPEPMKEKPFVYKCNDLWYKQTELYTDMKYEYWLLGRDPRTAKTQGVRLELKLCENFIDVLVMFQYHQQYPLMAEIGSSEIRAIHMIIDSDDLYQKNK